MKALKYFICLFLISVSSYAQLTVTSNSVATSMAQIIAGFGITISNASLTCGTGGSGTFTYTGGGLGLSNGVILTTGAATAAALSSGSNSSGDPGSNVSDAQLNGLEPSADYNLCRLEFDFVPICNTISLKFVFGSEEYPEFVNSSYNDAFGIFLTGPAPSGPAFNNKNIATLPNGTPVSIDNINSSSNNASYVANSGSQIIYDGYTTPITSTAAIVPCQSYHVKFAIADASDALFDSGVFIQYDGLSCANTPTVTSTSAPSSCSANTGSASVSVTGLTASGYSWQPGGQTSSSITGQPPGTYTCVMSFSSACTTFTQAQTVTIASPGVAPTVAVNSNTPCVGGSISLTSTSNGTTYSWTGPNSFSSGVQNPSIANVTSAAAGIYTVVVTNSVGCTRTTTLNVTLSPSPTITATSGTMCIGGSVNLTSAGATSYTWNSAATLNTANGNAVVATPASSTIYTITGLNGGCISTTTAAVTVNPKPAATLSFTNPTCGNSNGIIFINNTSSGGQTISSFASNLGSVSGQTVTGLGAGSPIITLTNNFGCTFTVSATLTDQPGPTAITTTPTNATCGNSNGSFTFGTPTGGTAPYTYAINGGAFSATSPTTGLTPGTYSVSLKDFNGCVFTKTVTIINVAGPTAISGTTTPAGCSMSNGTYNVTGVTGGTAPYSYSVDAVSTGSLTGSLSSGPHTISVKDFNGCMFSTTFSIIQTTGPTSANLTAGLATCGSANGTATVTSVTGGTPTYSYSFNGGPFTSSNNVGGLVANTHTVTIKDANSCTLTVTYNVLNNGSPTATVTGFTNPLCSGGSTGSFTVSASGGSGAPFTYTLTAPFQTNSTGVFSSLPAGTYNLNIKDVAGCATVASVTLTNPPPVVITATAMPAKCFGTATGTVNVTGSGGTPTYSYNLNGGTYQSSSVFPNQNAATYIMGIKDANGCLSTQTVTVSQPTALSINVSTQNANCTSANGIASATVTGGSSPITYTWTGGGGSGSVSNGLIGGNYTITASDANGCVVSSPALIGITPGGSAAITASTNITCNGANNGSLTTGMTGGTSPFTYSWSPGGQTTAQATNLGAGTFTCQVTDFHGCKAFASATLTQPTPLTAIMNSNNVKCFGTATGTVSAAGTGGTGPYTYLWPTIPSTMATVPNVGIGNYTCNVTDNNNCTISATITVTQPTSITLTSTVTPANCGLTNGSATVVASGGAPGAYSYTWSSGSNAATQNSLGAGTYTIIVQDANNCTKIVSATVPNTVGPVISIASQTNVSCFGGCNGVATASVTGGVTPYIYSWSNGNVSAIAPNLCAQIYTVSVTDQAGCVSSTSVTITQPTQLTVGIVANDPKCFGASNGFGIAAALGGTPGYTYTWSGGGGNSATSNPLGAGGYNLITTDANGCTVSSTMTLNNPPAMAASITATNVSCFGTCNGTAIATTTNGIGAVGYSWVGGASPISSQTASSLCAGTYTMVATDQNNCTASAIITITQPPVLTANISSTGSVTCNGGNNGFAVVSAGGGTPTYSYTWSGVASSSGNSANANTLPAGIYNVTVTDTKGCSVTTNAAIIEPAPFATTLTTTNAKCNGVCDGTANVAFSGGAGTTTFLWQPGLQSGNFVNTLCAGGQTVTITSNGSCPTVLTFTLTEPALLTAVASATNSNCGQNNGKACVVVAGGTSPFASTLWSNNVNSLCNNNILAGAYTFTVTDPNGCTATASGLVNDIAGPVVSVVSQTNVSCFGGTNGGATATISGGVPTYSISWTGTQSSPNTILNPINFGAGLHNITVVDAAGCIGTASVNITEPTQLVSAIGSFTNVSCNGLSNGGATVLVNGGTIPYNYTWTPGGQTSSILANVGANIYTAQISDGNGCLTSSSVVISQPQALILASSSFSNISCFGGSNGQISTTVQGGTPGYTYVWNPAQSGNSGVLGSLPAGGYSLTVTDSHTCSITSNFTILEPSILTSTYTSLPAKCGIANGSSTVTVGGGTPGYVLNWNTAPAQTGSVAINMAPGSNWQCVITDLNGCSITQTVNVNNAPSPIFSAPVVNQPSCFGMSNGDITLNYTSGTGPYTVVWSSPISQTTTASAMTQSISGIAQGAYTATLTDVNGCATSQQISVLQPGKLVLIPVISNPTICYGMSTQISASGQSGSPAYSYTWSPNPFVGGGPHTVNPTTTSSYTAMVSDSKGCTASPQILTVVVTPSLSISASSFTLCHNGTAVLTPTITSPGNGGPYSYTWTPAAGNVSSITTTGNAPTPGVATTNTIGLMVSDGCTIPNAPATFTIITNPLPSISFTTNTLAGCAPLSATLTGFSDGVNDVFTWSDRNPLGQGNPFPVVFQDTGKYPITLLVTNPTTGCSKSMTKLDYIEVYPQPVASFYADPSVGSIIDPNINFANTSQGAVSYMWDFGDPAATNGSNNSILTNPSHLYSFTGEYAVNLLATSSKGCTDIARINVEIKPDFALYIPNAFTPDENGRNDIFQPLGVGIDEENYRMDIFDRWGENIFTSNNFRKGWDGSVKGSSKMAPQGVYIYKLQVKDLQGGKHPYVGHVTVIRRNQ